MSGPQASDARTLHDLAVRVAREAAAHVRTERPAGRVQVAATKSSPTDVVTAIDRSTEELVRRLVSAERPDDGFLGEEDGRVPGTTDVVWVVDPIDGTVNFVYGIPAYAVSIGAEVAGEVVAGCVVNVATGEEFGAVRGDGAWTATSASAERRPLRGVEVPPPLDHALVGTGYNYVPEVRRAQAAAVARLLEHVRDVRRTGSAALDLCAVADGRLDAFVEQGLKPWDLAAGGLVARESGVVLAGLEDGPDERLTIAVPEPLAREFCAVVRACGF